MEHRTRLFFFFFFILDNRPCRTVIPEGVRGGREEINLNIVLSYCKSHFLNASKGGVKLESRNLAGIETDTRVWRSQGGNYLCTRILELKRLNTGRKQKTPYRSLALSVWQAICA